MDAKRARRIIIPAIVVLCALGVILTMVFRTPPVTPLSAQREAERLAAEKAAAEAAAAPTDTTAAGTDVNGALATPEQIAEADPDAADAATALDSTPSVAPASDGPPLTGLYAVAPDRGIVGGETPAASLGSVNASTDNLLVEFTRAGAGISRITLSKYWERWQAHKAAVEHYDALADGDTNPPPLPDADERYVLFNTHPRAAGNEIIQIPGFSAFFVSINGHNVNLFNYTTGPDGERRDIWAETAPGRFETTIRDAAGEVILEITRSFTLMPTGETTDIILRQSLRNVSGQTLDVQWKQYGPSDLAVDRSQYIDRRRVRFGYQRTDLAGYPVSYVYAEDDQLLERGTVVKNADKAAKATDPARKLDLVTLWPNADSDENPYDLSWMAVTNRYFACAVHPPILDPAVDSRSLSDTISEIRTDTYKEVTADKKTVPHVFMFLYSPVRTLGAGETTNIDFGIYAGPVDQAILTTEQPYKALNLGGLKIYVMSTFCAICTFQWLANLLLVVLSFFHDYIWHDWALSIIMLVIIVRALLHPILKKSQISMQRFSRQMSALKPEIDKLQKKFPNDPKRMQTEQMQLFREHGVNPLGCLSIVPMMLQTPIWIALYAMLYFAFDLRQEPGFYGIFQMIGGWPFLADLSASDHMLGEFAEPKSFLNIWNITGINVLPILMGVMFFFQHKYMAPPPSPSITKEQLQQQKIMRVLFVVMFPLMLYSAPSGLTLYILTSSTIGIIESQYIRNHIDEMDLLAKPDNDPAKKKAKTDPRSRAMQKAMEYHEKRRKEKREPKKSFKKRK
jgi:YidC/Oxa1 family membrane protein insertase